VSSVSAGARPLLLRRIIDFASTPYALYGAALLRIGYGVAGVAYYVSNYPERAYLWGPEAVFPFESFQNSLFRPAFSLYELADSTFMFEIIFHLGLLVAILFTVGIGGRSMTALHYVFMWSIYTRNSLLLDGGDNISFLVLLYLIPVDSTAVLAIRRSKQVAQGASARTILHNTGLAFIIAQLCIVYMASSMFKIQGQLWQDGTALYYILQVPEYSWPIITDHLVPHAWPIVFGTYATVFFQLCFPVMLMRPTARILAVVLGMAFHLGIALFMGLTSFSLYMIATEAILLSDRHYRWLGNRLKPLFVKEAESRDVGEGDAKCLARSKEHGVMALGRK